MMISNEEQVLISTVRVAERFKRESSAIFRDWGLSFSQYSVLRVLESAPGGQVGISEVSRKMLTSSPNLSGIAKRLDAGGFITRIGDENDERRTLLNISPKGIKAINEIAALQEKNIKSFFNGIGPKATGEILSILQGMLHE